MTYIYAGAETSGLYRLAPGREDWEELTNGLPESPSVCGIAIHPANPEVVFAGTQNGPYRSLDRGDTWERMDYPAIAPACLDVHVPARGSQRDVPGHCPRRDIPQR